MTDAIPSRAAITSTIVTYGRGQPAAVSCNLNPCPGAWCSICRPKASCSECRNQGGWREYDDELNVYWIPCPNCRAKP